MELFSKRNINRRSRFRRDYVRKNREDEDDSFIKDSTRVRVFQEIKFISSSDKFIERFLLTDNQEEEQFYIRSKSMSDLTLTALGYDISEYIAFKKIGANEINDDSKLFDLIEILLIFSKKSMRKQLVERFALILKEEDEPFALHGFMLINTKDTGLRAVASLIKEELLKKKITDFYDHQRGYSSNYEILAKTSVEILQLIFSSPKAKNETGIYAEELCLKVAQKWTNVKNVKNLQKLLNETVLNAKKLSNQISDIRHTDRTTIPVGTPNIYKLITSKNINIAELVILSLLEEFILEQDPEKLKFDYLKRYDVTRDSEWKIQKIENEIRIEEIPF